MQIIPRILVIAGSDSGAGAGIQADLKTVMALGGYATTAITALTAQNTLGISGIFEVDAFFVEQQISQVLKDIGADAVKIGMLASAQTIELVARQCETSARSIPIVLDPVLRSSSGAELLPERAIKALCERLLPQAALITPNTEEAAQISGVKIESVSDMQRAADRFLLAGASAVLLKGSHLGHEVIVDLLRTADGLERQFESSRIDSRATHGTGCTLSSAIATYLAHGNTLEAAVELARDYVSTAIARAPLLGHGHGPLNHAWPFTPASENSPNSLLN